MQDEGKCKNENRIKAEENKNYLENKNYEQVKTNWNMISKKREFGVDILSESSIFQTSVDGQTLQNIHA